MHDMYHDDDIKQQIRSLYARGNVLISKFRKCDHNVKVKLFKTYCTSLYGCNLWANYHKSVYCKLRNAYAMLFKNFFSAEKSTDYSMAMVQAGIDTIDVIIRKVSGSLFNIVCNSNNKLISTIVNSLYFCDSALYKKWLKNVF